MSDLSAWRLALWVIIGLLSAVLQARLIGHALRGTRALDATEAKRRLMRGYALRLGVMVPILAVAAVTGLMACLAWLGGHWAGRLLIWVLSGSAAGGPFSRCAPIAGGAQEPT